MARGKKTPALFEVIRNAQEKQKQQLERDRQKAAQQAAAATDGASPAAQLLRSPIYWFKGKHAHDAAAGLEQPVMRQTAAPTAPASPKRATPSPAPAEAEPLQVRPVPTPTPAVAPLPPVAPTAATEAAEPMVEPTPTFQPTVSALPTVPVPPTYEPTPAAPVWPTHSAAADQASREIYAEMAAQEAPAAEPLFGHSADAYDAYEDDYDAPATYGDTITTPAGTPADGTFSYTTAIVSAFAVIVACSVAYVAFHAAGKPAAGQVVQKVTRPDVLNLQTTPAAVTTTPPPADDGNLANVPSDKEQAVVLQGIGKPIPVPTNVKRVIGQQYLVLLSFPSPDDARDLVKFLAENGVAATAEKALPGYAKSWTSVVTVRGFDHTKGNPAFQKYSAALGDLLQTYAGSGHAGSSKFRKTFKIDVYTWRVAG